LLVGRFGIAGDHAHNYRDWQLLCQ
jgi:hypothetical protein